MIEILGYVVLGFVVGAMSSFFGIGGGVTLVAVMVSVAGFTQQEAQATALAFMVPTAAVGVALTLRLVGAERSGLGEVVLSTPTSRVRWYAAHVALPLALTFLFMVLLGGVVGIVGAFLAGLIVGGGSINDDITIMSFLWSLLGAVVLLAIVNLIRRGSVR